VDEERYFRTFRNHSLPLTGQHAPVDQQYCQFKDKELTPFLYEVPSQILRNGTYRFMQAYLRFRQGLAGRPVRKKKQGRQTVMITNELFQFVPNGKVTTTKKDGIIYEHKLIIGTDKFPVGELKFKAHRPYEIPKTITVSRHNGKWHISFNYAEGPSSDTQEPMSEVTLLEYFSGLTPEELDRITVGGDRGVAIPMATSNGINYDFTEIEKKRLAKAGKLRKKLQKKLSRQQPGSNRRSVIKEKIGEMYNKQRNIRQDRAHKSSRALVESDAQVFVFEDLPVKGMVKRPKPKKDERGKHIKNGAAAKSGLNKAILASMWGNIVLFTRYKGLKKEKLTIKIPASGTSQECSQCGHTHPDNRETQAMFHCQKCGFTANADHNASAVIKKRGIMALVDGKIQIKQKKSIRFRKGINSNDHSQIGQGLPESKRASVACLAMAGPGSATGQETTVRRTVGNPRIALVSVNREAPTSTAFGG
jgi:putative transposase